MECLQHWPRVPSAIWCSTAKNIFQVLISWQIWSQIQLHSPLWTSINWPGRSHAMWCKTPFTWTKNQITCASRPWISLGNYFPCMWFHACVVLLDTSYIRTTIHTVFCLQFPSLWRICMDAGRICMDAGRICMDAADYPAMVFYAVMLVVYLLLAVVWGILCCCYKDHAHQGIQVCVVCVCMCAFQNPNVYGYKCVCVPLPAASAVCMNALCLQLSIAIQSCHQLILACWCMLCHSACAQYSCWHTVCSMLCVLSSCYVC